MVTIQVSGLLKMITHKLRKTKINIIGLANYFVYIEENFLVLEHSVKHPLKVDKRVNGYDQQILLRLP